MKALYRSFREAGATHREAIACCLLTPIVIAGAVATMTALFFGGGFLAAGVKGL